jgi:AmpD protein
MATPQSLGLIEKLLPASCYSPRPLGRVRCIVQHYFSATYARPAAAFDLQTCWQLFHDLNFHPTYRRFGIYQGVRFAASAHVLIDRAGTGYLLAPLDRQAYHAGASEWNGLVNLNDCSIGIENIGAHGVPFTEPQYVTNARLCAAWLDQHGLDVDCIVGHEHVAVPPGRKKDPGPSFDWAKLRAYVEQLRAGRTIAATP